MSSFKPLQSVNKMVPKEEEDDEDESWLEEMLLKNQASIS
jgi:hypothetical protein